MPNEIYVILWIILWALLTWLSTSYNARNERKSQFNKELYYKMQEKLEVIFNGIGFYNANNRIIINSLIDWNHFEEDFKSNKIEERKWENHQKAQDYLYLYFSELNEDFLKCMDLYKTVINLYFEKILKAPSDWLSLNYSNEDRVMVLEKADEFNKEFIKFVDKLKETIEKYKNNVN